jgi:hypothetical protein
MPTRLVAIGDSLTQGFMNGSIFRTQMSYPVMLAQSVSETNFRVPDFSGEGGLPVNLEVLFHTLAKRYGSRIEPSDFVSAFMTAQGFLDRVEDYWERGEGTKPIQTGPMHNNLAVWGFQLPRQFAVARFLYPGIIQSIKSQNFLCTARRGGR